MLMLLLRNIKMIKISDSQISSFREFLVSHDDYEVSDDDKERFFDGLMKGPSLFTPRILAP